MLEVEDGGTKMEVQGGGGRMGSLGGITLFGFDLFTHNNADSDAAPLDIPSSKKSPIPKALKRRRRRRGKGAGEEGEEGDEEAGVVSDGEELEGFLGSRWIGAAFRRGLILGLALNPSKRGKV